MGEMEREFPVNLRDVKGEIERKRVEITRQSLCWKSEYKAVL